MRDRRDVELENPMIYLEMLDRKMRARAEIFVRIMRWIGPLVERVHDVAAGTSPQLLRFLSGVLGNF